MVGRRRLRTEESDAKGTQVALLWTVRTRMKRTEASSRATDCGQRSTMRPAATNTESSLVPGVRSSEVQFEIKVSARLLLLNGLAMEKFVSQAAVSANYGRDR